MSDFVSLYTALSGLRAAQTAMDVASHNVANVATPGYTRQRVGLASRLPYETPAGLVGTGVEVTDITRARDAFLDARVRAGAAGLGRLGARLGLLERAEAVLGEPDQGISGAVAGLWAAFEELALDPTSTAARQGVLGALGAVTGRANDVAAGWDRLAVEARRGLDATVAEANGLLAEVAALNAAIAEAVATGASANDQLDQRDMAVDRLATLVGANAIDAGDGTVRVSLDGMELVGGTVVRTIGVDAANELVHPSGFTMTAGGEVAGLQQVMNADLPAYRAQLDAFVEDLTAALNATHALGWSSATTAGGPLLAYTAGDAAATLSVAITDPADLAAAGSPGPPFPVFDGTNADRLAALRTDLVAAGGSMTLDEAVRTLTTGVAGDTAAARTAHRTQDTLQAATEFHRMGAHGVSLDEEMALLLQYQRSYEAAARVLTAVDETLETLVRRTGVVGR